MLCRLWFWRIWETLMTIPCSLMSQSLLSKQPFQPCVIWKAWSNLPELPILHVVITTHQVAKNLKLWRFLKRFFELCAHQSQDALLDCEDQLSFVDWSPCQACRHFQSTSSACCMQPSSKIQRHQFLRPCQSIPRLESSQACLWVLQD